MLASSFRLDSPQDFSQVVIKILGTFILELISSPFDQERARGQLLRLLVSRLLSVFGSRSFFGLFRLLNFGLFLGVVQWGSFVFSHEGTGFAFLSKWSLINLITLVIGLVALGGVDCVALVVVK